MATDVISLVLHYFTQSKNYWKFVNQGKLKYTVKKSRTQMIGTQVNQINKTNICTESSCFINLFHRIKRLRNYQILKLSCAFDPMALRKNFSEISLIIFNAEYTFYVGNPYCEGEFLLKKRLLWVFWQNTQNPTWKVLVLGWRHAQLQKTLVEKFWSFDYIFMFVNFSIFCLGRCRSGVTNRACAYLIRGWVAIYRYIPKELLSRSVKLSGRFWCVVWSCRCSKSEEKWVEAKLRYKTILN